LIDFDFLTFRLVNRDRAQIDGVEGALTLRPTQTLTARVHATLTDIDLGADEATLLYRPEEFGGLQVDWQLRDRWSLHAQGQFVGKREGSSVPTGQLSLDSYERVDLALSHDFSEQTTLFAALDNVLDEDYQEAVGFPNAGIQFRLGASVSF
jgi:outer membrane cobalamin receptor